ncbi:hypothetical protein [Methylobacterium nigriterrae]|uniref:hypothetical protein n=1 Tax=Methylobacterium nigriterrae TaxID=3127512 RepID=UPI0030132CAE
MPDLDQELEHFLHAHRHLADWRRRVADQRGLIEDMAAKGYDTALAKDLLRTMERTLEVGRRHQQLILEALGTVYEQGGGSGGTA